MTPWVHVDTGLVPGEKTTLRLMRQGDAFAITVGNQDLMRDRHCESERALATLDVPFALTTVDIDSDDELFKRYLERIPVVAVDGEELFDYEVDVPVLRRKLLER